MPTLTIISRSQDPFPDRCGAGEALGRELTRWHGPETVVLGIPRGGVIVAWRVAVALGAELDIMLSRKLGAPGNAELAVGSVAEDGRLFLDRDLAGRLGADDRYVEREKARQMEGIRKRLVLYRARKPKVPLGGRTVIVTDDGLATGATMQAALWSVRQDNPARLILAAPVAPEETLLRLSREADETVCLKVPPFFSAVGQFYRSFEQTTDGEVLAVLDQPGGEAKP
jgi:putative phosphoribosyl transferase